METDEGGFTETDEVDDTEFEAMDTDTAERNAAAYGECILKIECLTQLLATASEKFNRLSYSTLTDIDYHIMRVENLHSELRRLRVLKIAVDNSATINTLFSRRVTDNIRLSEAAPTDIFHDCGE